MVGASRMNRLHCRPAASLFCVLIVTLVGAPALVVPTGSASAAPQQGVSAGRYAAGVYAGPGNVGGVVTFASQSARPVTYAMDFIAGSTWTSIENPQAYMTAWQGKGYSMIWGVPILPRSGASLAKGATGAYNGHFATLARALVAAGQGGSVIRIGWEFNGIWFPWSAKGHAAQFIAYWRQIVTTMRSVPGANFRFEWNPTRGDLGAGPLSGYYPGNAYVDYVGLDVFDVEWRAYPGARDEFVQIKRGKNGLDWLASFSKTHMKPMVFPEWGLGWGDSNHGASVSGSSSVSGGDNPVFIRDMTGWFASHNVFESTFWDYGSSSVSGTKNHLVQIALGKDGSVRARASRR